MNPYSKQPEFQLCQEPNACPILRISGTLDRRTVPMVWEQAFKSLSDLPNSYPSQPCPSKSLILDMENVNDLDTAGAILISTIEQKARDYGVSQIRLKGLLPEFDNTLKSASHHISYNSDICKPSLTLSNVELMGKGFSNFWTGFQEFVSLFGEIIWAFFRCIIHPCSIRITETLLVAEKAGVNALPIVMLIAFIVGLVMAFQSAIPMKMFGVEIYVANLIGIAMVRELGPLMTAIVLAGRSASAFAAEIGTMKINEEIDALATMGLDPLPFLIIPRVFAAIILTPLLSLFANLVGILGGAVVIISLGYPMITYYNQVSDFVTWNDFIGGIVKCFAFGFLIAVTGCIRGYQTGQGASAVGNSTTSAVVTSIILIALTDGIFSIVYYSLGI